MECRFCRKTADDEATMDKTTCCGSPLHLLCAKMYLTYTSHSGLKSSCPACKARPLQLQHPDRLAMVSTDVSAADSSDEDDFIVNDNNSVSDSSFFSAHRRFEPSPVKSDAQSRSMSTEPLRQWYGPSMKESLAEAMRERESRQIDVHSSMSLSPMRTPQHTSTALEGKLHDLQTEKEQLEEQLSASYKETESWQEYCTQLAAEREATEQAYAEQIQQLEDTKNGLEATIQQLEGNDAELLDTITRLEEHVEQLQQDIASIEAERDTITSSERDLVVQKEAIESKLAASAARIEELCNEAQDMQLQEENEALQVELDQVSHTLETEREKWKQENDTLVKDNETLSEALTVLESKLEEVSQSYEDQLTTLRELEQTLETRVHELDKAKGEMQDLQEGKLVVEQQVQRNDAELAALRRSLVESQEECRQYQADNKSLLASNRSSEESMEQLRAQMQKDIAALQEEVEILRNTMAEERASFSAKTEAVSEAVRICKEEAEADRTTAAEKYKQLQVKAKGLYVKFQETTASLETSTAAQTEIQSQLEETQLSLDEAVEEQARLEYQLEHLKQEMERQRTTEQDIVPLQERVGALEAELSQQSAAVEEKETDLEDALQQLNGIHAELTATQELYHESQQQLEEVYAQLETASGAIDWVTKERDNMSVSFEELKKKAGILKHAYKKLQIQLQEKEEELDEAKKAVQSGLKEGSVSKDKLQQQCDLFAHEKDALQEQLDDVSAQLRAEQAIRHSISVELRHAVEEHSIQVSSLHANQADSNHNKKHRTKELLLLREEVQRTTDRRNESIDVMDRSIALAQAALDTQTVSSAQPTEKDSFVSELQQQLSESEAIRMELVRGTIELKHTLEKRNEELRSKGVREEQSVSEVTSQRIKELEKMLRDEKVLQLRMKESHDSTLLLLRSELRSLRTQAGSAPQKGMKRRTSSGQFMEKTELEFDAQKQLWVPVEKARDENNTSLNALLDELKRILVRARTVQAMEAKADHARFQSGSKLRFTFTVDRFSLVCFCVVMIVSLFGYVFDTAPLQPLGLHDEL